MKKSCVNSTDDGSNFFEISGNSNKNYTDF